MRKSILLALMLLAASAAQAAPATVAVQILGNGYGAHGGPKHPNDITVGYVVTITLQVRGAQVGLPPLFPQVSGLMVSGSGINPGSKGVDLNYFVTGMRPGDILVPTFDIHTSDGQTLHVAPIALHVLPK